MGRVAGALPLRRQKHAAQGRVSIYGDHLYVGRRPFARVGGGGVVRLLVATLLALVLAGCVGPARTESDYLADIRNTAKSALSAVESTQLTVSAVVENKATAPYVSLRLSEDESRVQSAITAFNSVQPPSQEMDVLRAEVLTTLQQAASVLADLRIAAYRDNNDRLADIARPLAPISEQLGRYRHLRGA